MQLLVVCELGFLERCSGVGISECLYVCRLRVDNNIRFDLADNHSRIHRYRQRDGELCSNNQSRRLPYRKSEYQWVKFRDHANGRGLLLHNKSVERQRWFERLVGKFSNHGESGFLPIARGHFERKLGIRIRVRQRRFLVCKRKFEYADSHRGLYRRSAECASDPKRNRRNVDHVAEPYLAQFRDRWFFGDQRSNNYRDIFGIGPRLDRLLQSTVHRGFTRIGNRQRNFSSDGERWTKRNYFRDEEIHDLWNPTIEAPEGTILGEILAQIREARDFYRDAYFSDQQKPAREQGLLLQAGPPRGS